MFTKLLVVLLCLGTILGAALLFELLIYRSTFLVRNYVKLLVKRYRKAAGLFVFFVLWFGSPYLAAFVADDGQRPVLMDVGVFQTILLATIRGLILYSFDKLFLKHEFPQIHAFLFRGGLDAEFKTLTAWQKSILSVTLLLGCWYLFSQLTH